MWNVARVLLVALLADAIPAAVIGGRIIEDHTGEPITSAEVKIRQVGARLLAADLETDSEGRFQTPEIPDGDYRISISKANHASVSLNLNAATASSLTVRLIRGGTVLGRVTDRNGQPVSNASVFALSKSPGTGTLKRMLTACRHATTGPSGQYRLYNLPPGRYVMAVSYGNSTTAVGSTGSAATAASLGSGFQLYPDNTRQRLFEIAGGEETSGIDFNLQPGALHDVSGKVDLPERKGAYWLGLTPVDQTAMTTAVAQTKEDGQFSFANIPSGSYYLFASGPTSARSSLGAHLDKDPLFARKRLDLAQNVEGLTVAMQKGLSIQIQLSADSSSKLHSTCASSAKLVLSSLEDWGSQLERTASIDFESPASLASLAPARYSATVTGLGPGCHAASEIPIDLSGVGSASSFTIPISPPGTIRGVVAGATADVLVALLPENSSSPVMIAAPDSASRFSFRGLNPGRYRIWTQQPAGGFSSRPNAMDVEVGGGATVEVNLNVKAAKAP